MAKIIGGTTSTPIKVDTEYDYNSRNPIANSVVTQALHAIDALNKIAYSNAEAAIELANAAGREGHNANNMLQYSIIPRLDALENYVTPQMFGAKGDGVTDDTAAIQAAMDANYTAYAPDGTKMTAYYPVYIPAGTYLIDGYYKDFLDSPNGGIKLHSGQRVYMDSDCTIKVKPNDGAFYEAFNVCGRKKDTPDPNTGEEYEKISNVEIHGGKIIGERQKHDISKHPDNPDTEDTDESKRTQGFGIAVQYADNVLIDNVDISEMWGDAIVLHTPDNVHGFNTNITIRDCYLHDCERQGISVVVGDNVLISNCIISNISGHDPQSGIDIEPHGQAGEDMYVHDVTIENCKFIDNVQSMCFSKCYNLTVNNCVFDSHVIAVRLATNVQFNNCDIRTVWTQNDCEPSFYGCRIGRVTNETAGIARFYDCYFTGHDGGASHSYILTGNKGGSAHFKNCEFMLKCEGTDKTYCRIVNGAGKARFEGCSFATVDNEPIRMFDSSKGEYEFYGCEINLTTQYDYLFMNSPKLIMKNCNVKTTKHICLYTDAVDRGYVFLSGNVFDTNSHICRVNDGTTFATPLSMVLLNNARNNDVSHGFVRAIDGVKVTDINNTKIGDDIVAKDEPDDTSEVLSRDITYLNSEVLRGYIIGDHKNPTTNTWNETASWRTTVIPVSKIVSLTRAELNTNTLSAYAVSFYSSENISADSFISGLLFSSGVHEEFTDIVIPSNAVIAVFCDRVNHDNIEGEFVSSIEGVSKSVIKDVYENIDNARAALTSDIENTAAELSAGIDKVGEEVDFMESHLTVPLTLDDATTTRDCYISADGTPTNTPAWRSYLFDVSEYGAASVSVGAYSHSKICPVISFYSENEINSANFISGVFVTDSTQKNTFTDVPVPTGTKLVVASSRRSSGTDETAEVKAYAIAKIASEISHLSDELDSVNDAVDGFDERLITLESIDIPASIEALRNEKPVDLMTNDFKFGNYYINSSGEMAGSGSWSSYAVAATYPKIVFNGYTNSAVNYVVGFYASDIPSDDTFISSLNVTPSSSVQEIIIDKSNTPEGTKSILFCTRTVNGQDSSLVGVTTIVEQVNGLLADVEKLESDVAIIKNELAVATANRVVGKGNIKAIYRDIPNNNDFAIIGDEIWFNQDGNGNSPVHRYKITEDGLVPIAQYIPTDFGHWNCVDYNEENDCLVFGNGANDAVTEGNFFAVVPHPRAITGSATLDTHAIRYPVDIGYKVQAVWGDSNLGKNNIVYLLSDNAKTITKVLLKQNADGSFYKDPNTGCGEYSILETGEQSTHIGVGGSDFWGDTLYIGDGDYHGYKEMSMTDYSVKSVSKSFYRDDGTKITGSTQGVHVDSDYLWVYYNVKFAEQEHYGESYLVQYYR